MYPVHIFSKPLLAQATRPSQPATVLPISQLKPSQTQAWMVSTLVLLVLLVVLIVYGKSRLSKVSKIIKFEQYKNQDLKEKLKLALVTIRKMETNPDLVYAREFNLDYLRMRMDEEVFHYIIINQIKLKVSQLIGEALRPSTEKNPVGIVAGGRTIDQTFDVTYEIETPEGKWNKGVLFRIQIKLTKLPIQLTSTTLNEIIDCIEKFLAPSEHEESWQPSIQGHIVFLSWDQKAKPTPLLVLEQSEEGVNVSFRTHPTSTKSPIQYLFD